MSHALGIDLGSTNAKVALVRADGTLVATAARAIETRRDGDVAEQDARDLWRAVVDAVRDVTAADPRSAADVLAVAVCSQYSSIVAVDEAGEPVADLVLYLDQRGTDHSLAILERHPEAWDTWIDVHGIPPFGGGLSLAHVLHLQLDRPDVHERAVDYLEPMDYVNLRLTGRAAATQCTMFMSQLCDNRELGSTRYAADLLRMADVDPEKLPELIAADSPVGALRPEVAAELGLPATAVVYAGANDSHAGAVATGASVPGRAGVMIGTTTVLLDEIGHKASDLDHGVLSMPSPYPEGYLVWAENGLGGKALEHVLEHVVYATDELADHLTDDHFRRLDDALRSVPAGSDDVLFLPWLNGSMSPDLNPSMRGGFLNLSLDTRRTHLVRAVVEGISFNLRSLVPVVEDFTGRSIDEVTFGGGAARSGVWAQILADVLDRPVHTLADPDQANARAMGLLALLRAGELTPADVTGAVSLAATYEPGSDRATVYDRLHEQFVAAYTAVRPICEALNR